MSSAYIFPCSDTFSIHLFMFSLAKVTQNVTILTRLAIFHVLYTSVSYFDSENIFGYFEVYHDRYKFG